jgi:hypothetical protein
MVTARALMCFGRRDRAPRVFEAAETLASTVGRRTDHSPLLSPSAGLLASLPQAAEVAAPWASGTLQLAAQVAAPSAWPAASTLTPVHS